MSKTNEHNVYGNQVVSAEEYAVDEESLKENFLALTKEGRKKLIAFVKELRDQVKAEEERKRAKEL